MSEIVYLAMTARRAASGERRAGTRHALVLFLLAICCSPLAAQESVTALVPVVGSVLGANEIVWHTGLELENATQQETTVAISLPTAPDQPLLILTMPPASVQRFDDVVGEAFGLPSAMSPLLVQTAGRRSVTIRATAYGVRGAELFRPQPIGAIYGDTYYPIHYLHGLSFSDAYRTNIGVVNLGDEPATFTLALQRIQGRNLAMAHFSVPPHSMWHQSVRFFFPAIEPSEEQFSVLIESFSRKTYVYGSVLDNATNEARFIDAVVGAQ